jgi:hypothetical protein
VILLILGERSPPDRHAREITRIMRVMVMAVEHAHDQGEQLDRSKVGNTRLDGAQPHELTAC